MAYLTLQLLGGFDARLDSVSSVEFSSRKARALLAYLARHPGQRHSREKLAALLWGNSGDEQARDSVRQTLVLLRKSLGHAETACVVNDGDAIYLNPDQVEVDVARFDALCRQATPDALDRATAICQGEFLDGFIVKEESFDAWLHAERAQLNERRQEALHSLLDHYGGNGDADRGIQVAVCLLAIDPLQEGVHRALMRFYLAADRRGAALRQYQICREVLHEDLGIVPEPETEKLHQQLLGQDRTAEPAEAEPDDAPARGADQRDAPLDRPVLPAPGAQPATDRRWHLLWLASATAALLLGAASVAALWWRQPDVEPAPPWHIALPLSDRPSIAVLPFRNMSADPSQDYFAEGIAEDVITDLSKLANLFVIARNSSFAFKNRPLNAGTIARRLGVRYVLEGSVRRSGNRLRINAKLIDATTGGHIWADRYDGAIGDVFALQDQVTARIVGALAVELSGSEQVRLAERETDSPAAYDAFLLGLRHLNAVDRWRPDDNEKARAAFERAIELDADYAAAYAGLGWTHWFANKLFPHTELDSEKPFELANKSLRLSDNPLAHRLLARRFMDSDQHQTTVLFVTKTAQFDLVLTELRTAVALEPNNPDSLAELAKFLVYSGELSEADKLIRKAKRLNPNFPSWYYQPAGVSAYLTGNYAQAIGDFAGWFESDVFPTSSALWLAAAEAQTGDLAAAKAALAVLRGEWRNITTYSLARFVPLQRQQDADHLLAGLRKAGLPDPEPLD